MPQVARDQLILGLQYILKSIVIVPEVLGYQHTENQRNSHFFQHFALIFSKL